MQLGFSSFAFDALFDPIYKLLTQALITTEMNTTECLGFPKQPAYVLDSGFDQPSHR